MYSELGAPVAAQSAITMIITACTIAASLATTPLMRHMGTGKLTACSVAMTAAAILGFSASTNLWQLCLIAIPYGLGAGAVDAALNNYVAINYGDSHMSWLHACWGIGTSISPVIMGWALASPLSWHGGYLAVGILQAIISATLFFSLPLWKHGAKSPDKNAQANDKTAEQPPTYAQALKMPGAKAAILSFGFYSAFEYVCGLWSSSHLVLARGISESNVAIMVSLFYMGITAGRLLSGFATRFIGSKQLIRIGQGVIACGIALLMVGQGTLALGAALALIGLGCAPIYPSIIALTPKRFGETASQSLVSLQMACAYIGSTFAPPICAVMVSAGGAAFVPLMLAAVLAAMFVFAEMTNKKLEQIAR